MRRKITLLFAVSLVAALALSSLAFGTGSSTPTIPTSNNSGNLYAWGYNPVGYGSTVYTPQVINADAKWKDISTSGGHTVAIKDNGTLWAWGAVNTHGRLGLSPGPASGNIFIPTQVGTATNWTLASAGESHTLAIRSDGTLWAWGNNLNGRTGLGTASGSTLTPTQVGSATSWAYVSAGNTHTVAIKDDGTLWTWGLNTNGRTGLGTAAGSTLVPTQVGAATSWVYASAGNTNTSAIRSDGTLWSWGANTSGQTGLGTTTGNTLTPTQVGTATNWTYVSVGWNHTLAIRSDGTLWAWGSNQNGRTGLDTRAGSTPTPAQVGTATSWTSVSTPLLTDAFSYGVKGDGTLWFWGQHHRTFPNLTHIMEEYLSPVQVQVAITNWSSAPVISGASMFAIVADGSLYTWGNNDNNRLGLNLVVLSESLSQVYSNYNWAYISAGQRHTVAIKDNGTLWAWGNNRYGRTGLGTVSGTIPMPTQVGTAANWAYVSTGLRHTVAIKDDGTLWSWGVSLYTGLGIAAYTTMPIPTQVGTATSWAYVSAGNTHTVAIKDDGTLWTWGLNNRGQTGLGHDGFTAPFYTLEPTQIGTATNWAYVSAGESHTLAIRSDGTLWAWGNNVQRQLGTGSAIAQELQPVRVGSISTWQSVYAGAFVSFGIRTDGSLWAWGSNNNSITGRNVTNGTTNTPARIGTGNDWSSVAAGEARALATRTDGSLWAWGTINHRGTVQAGTPRLINDGAFSNVTTNNRTSFVVGKRVAPLGVDEITPHGNDAPVQKDTLTIVFNQAVNPAAGGTVTLNFAPQAIGADNWCSNYETLTLPLSNLDYEAEYTVHVSNFTSAANTEQYYDFVHTFITVALSDLNPCGPGCTPGERVSISSPTCTEYGTWEIRCTVCDEVIEVGTTSPLGHRPGNSVRVADPTCTEPGLYQIHCIDCSELLDYEVILPLGHRSGEIMVVQAPTETTYGRWEIRCDWCNTIMDYGALPMLEPPYEPQDSEESTSTPAQTPPALPQETPQAPVPPAGEAEVSHAPGNTQGEQDEANWAHDGELYLSLDTTPSAEPTTGPQTGDFTNARGYLITVLVALFVAILTFVAIYRSYQRSKITERENSNEQ